MDIHLLAHELRARRWAVALFPKHIRVVIMPHIREEHIRKFLDDLNDIVQNLKL